MRAKSTPLPEVGIKSQITLLTITLAFPPGFYLRPFDRSWLNYSLQLISWITFFPRLFSCLCTDCKLLGFNSSRQLSTTQPLTFCPCSGIRERIIKIEVQEPMGLRLKTALYVKQKLLLQANQNQEFTCFCPSGGRCSANLRKAELVTL